jgi:hypothetical protein
MTLPNEKFLNKIAVDKVIKPILDEEMMWEGMVKHQSTNAQVVLYYKEQYVQVETPNDTVMTRSVDPKLRAPTYRGEGGLFPYMDVSGPAEYNLRLNQIALATKWTEEEMRYAEMENRVLKKQKGLATAFAGYVNTQLINTITENWSTSPSSIQQVGVGSSTSWADAVTASNPPKNLLDAMEKIEDLSGYNYKANAAMISKQSYYDLMNWVMTKDYEYHFNKPDSRPEVLNVVGLDIIKTNNVKRDFGIVADFQACGVMYEA